MSASPARPSGVTDAELDELVGRIVDALEEQSPELRDSILGTLRDPVDGEALLARMVRYARERAGREG